MLNMSKTTTQTTTDNIIVDDDWNTLVTNVIVDDNWDTLVANGDEIGIQPNKRPAHYRPPIDIDEDDGMHSFDFE